MKFLAFAAAAVFAAGAALADPVEGVWQTQPDEGSYAHVKMAPCGGGKVCGKITRTFNNSGEYKSPNIGKTLVINMQPQGGGKYEGKVWQPAKDRIFLGKMALNGNRLQLSGCVAGGLICKNQTWARIQ
ncbi:DUF2147 domain-containing protein [Sagittula sp. SSi028]|uniref:DUF2147 domain-containing protein n=1 Tax=Sagittula sp. SSi028 TaxID=3400636 RepID=UPI003AF63B8D